jgi:hypothetical protein
MQPELLKNFHQIGGVLKNAWHIGSFLWKKSMILLQVWFWILIKHVRYILLLNCEEWFMYFNETWYSYYIFKLVWYHFNSIILLTIYLKTEMCNEFCVGIHLVPMGQEHTWENKGLKDIKVIWMEGKQQVMCCVSCA